MSRRLLYYANCNSSFNPTVFSQFLLMCGDINPNPGPTTTNTNGPRDNQTNLHCMHMNARSLKKNIHSHGNLYTSNLLKFQEMIYSEMLDIMFVTETWLNSDISSKEILPHGYNIYRTDRSLEQTGGGVLVAIKHGVFINCSQLTSIATSKLEAVAISNALYQTTKNGSLCVVTDHLSVKIYLILDPLLIIYFQVTTRLLLISTFQIFLG